MEGLFLILIVGLPAIFLYLLPAFIANHRGHINQNAIFLVNLLFGWTFIGWGVALVWAFGNSKPQIVYVQQPPATN